ncbi:MAG: hypothetical protein AAGB34_08065 [Planctomycetota bacterium]
MILQQALHRSGQGLIRPGDVQKNLLLGRGKRIALTDFSGEERSALLVFRIGQLWAPVTRIGLPV